MIRSSVSTCGQDPASPIHAVASRQQRPLWPPPQPRPRGTGASALDDACRVESRGQYARKPQPPRFRRVPAIEGLRSAIRVQREAHAWRQPAPARRQDEWRHVEPGRAIAHRPGNPAAVPDQIHRSRSTPMLLARSIGPSVAFQHLPRRTKFLQHSRQLPASAMNPCFHLRNACPQHLGNLRVRHVLVLAQHQCRAKMFRQPVNGVTHALDGLPINHPPYRRLGPAGMLIGYAGHFWSAKYPQGLVHHRPPHQSTGLAPVVAVAMLIQVHQSLLHDILGRRPAGNDGPRDRQKPPGVLPHGPLE